MQVTPDGARPWYEELREAYRPQHIRVVFLAESPPDPAGRSRRFFYAPELTQYDNLFRSLMQALYGATATELRATPKDRWLRRFQEDGYWLLDAAPVPVNHLANPERRRILRNHLPRTVAMLRDASPSEGLIVCHAVVYEIAAPAIRAAGLRLLHDHPLPFPLGNWRRAFVEGVRQALGIPHGSPG